MTRLCLVMVTSIDAYYIQYSAFSFGQQVRIYWHLFKVRKVMQRIDKLTRQSRAIIYNDDNDDDGDDDAYDDDHDDDGDEEASKLLSLLVLKELLNDRRTPLKSCLPLFLGLSSTT